MKVKSNEMGTCPMCNGCNLDYGCADFVEDMVYYPWTCADCRAEGEEWYKLDFVGHNVIMENCDCVEITEDMIESEELV